MLNAPISMGYVDAAFAAPGTQVDLMVRGQARAAEVVTVAVRSAQLCSPEKVRDGEDVMITRYTKDHEWVRLEGRCRLDWHQPYAAEQLGDVVYVELPAVGKAVTQGGEMAVVESAKAASDVYAPVAGEVVAVNDALSGAA